MKIILIANLFSGMCVSYLYWTSAAGQYAENPELNFVPFKLDTILRGSFNISKCLVQLMECFELMRPDVICDHSKYQDTICPVMKDKCHDYYGPYKNYRGRFVIYEAYCHYITKEFES